jgi:hypothetical protein
MFKNLHLTIILFFGITAAAVAQSGAIKVTMTDDKKQPIPFANVVVEKSGAQIAGGTTDIDGNVTIKPLDPGQYDVKAVAEGFQERVMTGVIVSADKTVYLEMPMQPATTILKEVTVKFHRDILPPNTQSGQVIDKEDIEHLPTKDVNTIATLSAGVMVDGGGNIHMRGSRSEDVQYIVDGVKISADQIEISGTPTGIPQNMIEQETVITGGTPANYGDATGGVIEINTVNASPKFFGGVQAITSELLDPFGYNDVNVSFGGPIYSKKDTATKGKIPIIDFVLGGEFKYQKDGSPSFVGAYSANGDTLSQMQKYPLIVNQSGGLSRAAEYVTADQITQTAAHNNAASESISVNGKLGFRINNNVRVVAGGTYEYDNQQVFSFANELFNSPQDPLLVASNYRTYVKLTQRFPTPESKEKQSIIRNAYYTLQLSYSGSYSVQENPFFKDNVFDYGYVGQFDQYYSKQYTFKDGRYGTAYYETSAQGDSLYTFKPGTLNPLLVNYTNEVYNIVGQQSITSLNTVQQNQGIINGGSPENIYSLWLNTGNNAFYNYIINSGSHLDFNAYFSADIKNHALQVGFEYEQNIIGFYSLNPDGLWGIMRQNVNTQISGLDTNHPYITELGQYNHYGLNPLYVASSQSQIDKSIRQKLGLAQNSTTFIEPDNYEPSFYSLNMFSASDLLNNGNGVVNYLGYNYNGTPNTSNPSIDDFFNQTDANGNHTYPVAPYHPIYIAAFIQDHFDIKNLKFDVGVRLEDFNANQPVLKDPYLMSNAKTVSEVEQQWGNGLGEIPSNMGNNYTVYVNDYSSPTAIVGYRNGNSWYNANGNLLTDPSVLASSTTTGSIQPYLENPSQITVNASSFTNYTPQVSVLPRIAFSFPISDVANFFAHYDILSSRPAGLFFNDFNPLDYLFLPNRQGSLIANPNLLPQKTTDYELGFSQVLNEQRTSAITISAFYRDMQDQVQIYRYYLAFPITYLSYSNIDFGTIKGLEVTYELRRVNNVKLRATYTLQFANGTGSGPNSGFNLANSGEPNLQIPQPLSFDQRHTFNINLDYHYGSGADYNGPVLSGKGGNSQILANSGFNLNINAGSGTPYTSQAQATEGGNGASPSVAMGIAEHYSYVGSINGEYLPWQFTVNLRIDKDFPVVLMKNKGDKARHCDLVVYLYATNLLNTENVQGVYSFTGSPSDDGWLTSLTGQQAIPGQTDPQAFVDQYKIKEQNPAFISLPRQIKLGLEFNF